MKERYSFFFVYFLWFFFRFEVRKSNPVDRIEYEKFRELDNISTNAVLFRAREERFLKSPSVSPIEANWKRKFIEEERFENLSEF